jgi:hypothetical protein
MQDATAADYWVGLPELLLTLAILFLLHHCCFLQSCLSYGLLVST